jgi:hypothetical protein
MPTPVKLTIEQLTAGTVAGAGAFDQLMVSLVAHLTVEYTANRISGAEYTKAYIGIVAAALQTAQQFLVAADQAYWSALTAEAQIANLVLQGEGLEITNNDILPQQALLLAEQTEVQRAQTMDTRTNGTTAVAGAVGKQIANLVLQGTGLEITNDDILPQQALLLAEQTEVQRAQTMDTRTNGTTAVAGAVGKQKDLYTQQVASYRRDAETKVAKIFSDAWITQKTIDEGLVAPTEFSNANINAVLTAIRTANSV